MTSEFSDAVELSTSDTTGHRRTRRPPAAHLSLVARRCPYLKASSMRTLRRFQIALVEVLKARQRALVSVLVTVAAFALGALVPQDRVLGGAAVAAVAVALTQVLLYIADNRNRAGGSNATPVERR
ncbi:hypothetical protein ACN24M_19635 [Streptomyces microflavus]|uniref:hypothetical protein n=1 Tax=Streptomyces microflavus TaxID=1919 RepID=UPI003B22240C